MKKELIIENRRGWIRIVESLIAILLIVGVFLMVIAQSKNQNGNISTRVHDDEVYVLRGIQLNESLRQEIAGISATLPIEWIGFDSIAPMTKAQINKTIPGYLNCSAKICSTSDLCILMQSPQKTIYAESVIISSSLQAYNPKSIKLFCWEK